MNTATNATANVMTRASGILRLGIMSSRVNIDALLKDQGWHVGDPNAVRLEYTPR
ncbi:MAG: hypothetical protein R3E77_10485 [Steroidobacteraceae bacterium]